MTPPKIILGVDPGSTHLGIGCIRKSGNHLQLILAETISAPPKEAFYDRLEEIHERLLVLIDELKPHEVAIEDIFFAKNVRSAFKLGIVRGVVFAACMARGIKLFEYLPTQVKSVVTGYGRADKAQVQKMVNLLLGTDIKSRFDATDAVAIAICHASTNRIEAFKTC